MSFPYHENVPEPSRGTTLLFVSTFSITALVFAFGILSKYHRHYLMPVVPFTIMAYFGLLATHPPLFLVLMVITVVANVYLMGFSTAGKDIVEHLKSSDMVSIFVGSGGSASYGGSTSGNERLIPSLALLMILQSFRIPVEIFLHTGYDEGFVPKQMTWKGKNLDVVSGVLGLVIGCCFLLVDCARRSREKLVATGEGNTLLAGQGEDDQESNANSTMSAEGTRQLQKTLMILYNLIGLSLLINVVATAVLSMPTPIGKYFDVYLNVKPPLVFFWYSPFHLLPLCLVQIAFAGHVLSLRTVRDV